MEKCRQAQEIKIEDVNEACLICGTTIKELFYRAGRKHALHLYRSNITRDAEQYLYLGVPEYVLKYVNRILAEQKRRLRREAVKRLPPPYRRPSPAQVRW